MAALAVLLGVLPLSACAVPFPTEPTVIILPPSGKTYVKFQGEDTYCRRLGYQQVRYEPEAQSASSNANTTVGVNTVGGAVIGALIGSIGGRIGAGALVGAGYGLLIGSIAASHQVADSADTLQSRFNIVYVQCMFAYGNRNTGHMSVAHDMYSLGSTRSVR